MMEAKLKPNTIVGIFIIIIGSLFLLKNFGVLPQEFFWKIFGWQAIIILIGIIFYFNSNKSIGVTLIVLGILSWIPDIWPVLIIALGVFVIIKNKTNYFSNAKAENSSDIYDPNQMINDVSIFGGAKKSYQIDKFKGGNITAIFGGSEIDLSDCTLADGSNKLNIFFLFGGSNIKVPSSWKVLIEVTPILGAFTDRRIIQQSQVFDNSKTLIISGVTIFGGGELKNYIKF
ncbi:MAG: hypothetical protein COW71_10280 [Ignavibacteriales bacterium CG18_big_fil_WC_8_21_14_2_50_31_20]|nr:MAG: hypothetical protein COW71_10280 [Ignavibacteriales bacterium CG18_big_fil_WC_8_21_14_2_50_31_20]